jgi:hypothetical protein
VFNLLITNVDDHLQNLGFLYVGLLETELEDFAPAFEHPDMNAAQSLLAKPDEGLGPAA